MRPVLIATLLAFGFWKDAQALAKKKRSHSPQPTYTAPKKNLNTGIARRRNSPSNTDPFSQNALKVELGNALKLAQSGQYQNAAAQLFNLSRRPELAAERPQVKYILGLMLMEMKLSQVAAFQFVEVIRSGNARYSKLAIEKLSIVADYLGDDTLLNYAISRVDLADMPEDQKDMIYFRLGEIKQKNLQFEAANSYYSRVQLGSSYYNQALFNRGLSHLELNQTSQAIQIYQNLLQIRSQAPILDTNRVAAQLALARSYYQAQKWEEALQAYSEIPRDHILWHEALFEQSWAYLRAAKFRSALSNFQSLHSAYYEDSYIPESLLLRGIVYLYICKYEEMEKVLALFEKTYGPVRGRLTQVLKDRLEPLWYYGEIEKAQGSLLEGEAHSQNRLPLMILKGLVDQGDIRRSLGYLQKLGEERSRIESSAFRGTPLASYGLKILINRVQNTKVAIGEMAKVHLQDVRSELRDLYEQSGFIRYEMINGRKEAARKRLAGKETSESSIEQDVSRESYARNGYDFYPFQGEYWLDEIGNYHYLGKSSCH